MEITKGLSKLWGKILNVPKNLSELGSNQTAIFLLIGILILIVAFMAFKKIKLDAKMITMIGVAIALSTVLKAIKIYRMPQGGSVTLGSMIPIFIVAYLYGPNIGFLTGFLFGILDLILGPWIVHPVQVLFDYPLPFMAMGVFGFFNKKSNNLSKIAGVSVAMALRFACHFISGIVFFASNAPAGTSPILYSITYNISYLLPELIISAVVLCLIPLERFKTFQGNVAKPVV